jgi:hemerythrin superfamily protein
MSVIKLLRKDHSEVQSLLSRFNRTDKPDPELFARIRRDLQIHLRAEEEIFYASIKAVNDEGRRLISEAVKEHRDIDELLLQISRMKPGATHFAEKLETLIENIDHHIEEEEGEIFQFAEENCSSQQLAEIAEQIQQRKRVLGEQMAA